MPQLDFEYEKISVYLGQPGVPDLTIEDETSQVLKSPYSSPGIVSRLARLLIDTLGDSEQAKRPLTDVPSIYTGFDMTRLPDSNMIENTIKPVDTIPPFTGANDTIYDKKHHAPDAFGTLHPRTERWTGADTDSVFPSVDTTGIQDLLSGPIGRKGYELPEEFGWPVIGGKSGLKPYGQDGYKASLSGKKPKPFDGGLADLGGPGLLPLFYDRSLGDEKIFKLNENKDPEPSLDAEARLQEILDRIRKQTGQE